MLPYNSQKGGAPGSGAGTWVGALSLSHVAVCTGRRTRTSGGCLECGGRRARCCPRSEARSPGAPPPCARASPLTSPPRPPPPLVLVLLSKPLMSPRCHPWGAGCVPTCRNLCCDTLRADEMYALQRLARVQTKASRDWIRSAWDWVIHGCSTQVVTHPAPCPRPLFHAAQAWSRSWEVVRGQCDADGWQYAAGWPKGGAQWAAAPTLSHVVRRRRWRRARVWTGTLCVSP